MMHYVCVSVCEWVKQIYKYWKERETITNNKEFHIIIYVHTHTHVCFSNYCDDVRKNSCIDKQTIFFTFYALDFCVSSCILFFLNFFFYINMKFYSKKQENSVRVIKECIYTYTCVCVYLQWLLKTNYEQLSSIALCFVMIAL